MNREDELTYIFNTRQNQMDRKMLIEYIYLLQNSNHNMMETLEDISKQHNKDIVGEEEEEDIDIYNSSNDTSSEYYNEDARNQKEDLD